MKDEMLDNKKTLWRRFRRFAKFFYLKIMRSTGSPEYIGRGVAAGLFICFFLPIGFQTVPALAFAFLIKGAKIPAVIFTWISNYATVVIIYPVQCFIGSYLIFNPISYHELTERLKIAFGEMKQMSFDSLLQLGWELTAAFFAGGLLFGVLSAVPGYFLTVKLVREFQAHRAARRKKRAGRKL